VWQRLHALLLAELNTAGKLDLARAHVRYKPHECARTRPGLSHGARIAVRSGSAALFTPEVTPVMARRAGRCHGAQVRIGNPVADRVGLGPDGVRLWWRRPCAEARYCGLVIGWSQVRDADPGGYPPQLRLRDGRTVFVSRLQHEQFAGAVAAANVAVVRRPEVWADLLEPFLDTDYALMRSRCEQRLRSLDLADTEVAGIRRRIRGRMSALTALTWEWGGYGQYDLLLATALFIRGMPWSRYRRFRAWTDAVADRPTGRTLPQAPHLRSA